LFPFFNAGSARGLTKKRTTARGEVEKNRRKKEEKGEKKEKHNSVQITYPGKKRGGSQVGSGIKR